MTKLILSLLTATVLAGCSSTPTHPALDDTPVYATPAQRAYQLGMEHRMVQSCRAKLGGTLVSRHAQSADLLLASYPVQWKEATKSAFARGLATEPDWQHRVPCEAIPALMNDQIACNEAETRKNLKVSAHLK